MRIRHFTMVLLAACLQGCVLLVPFIEADRAAPDTVPPKKAAAVKCSMNAGDIAGINQGRCAAASERRPDRREERQQRRLAQLLKQLAHQDAAVRTNAATDIGAMGPAAGPAVGALAHAARYDNSKWVRRAAVKSLPRISTGVEVVKVLHDALQDSNKWVAHSAEGALKKIGTKAARSALMRRDAAERL